MNRYHLFVLLGSLMVVTGVACTPSQEGRKAAPPEDVKTVVEGNNEFAFDLYHRLSQKEGNIVFSPYSISTALAMTYAGARGNTAQELAKTLHFSLDNERLHPAFGELIRQIEGTDKKPNYDLAVANSLWGARGLSLEPRFLRFTQSDYRAGFETVDFVNDAEGARRRINGWVEDKTNQKIQDLLAKGVVDQTTRLALVNAIYFKGDWLEQFGKEQTFLDKFKIPGKPAVKVPMMHGCMTVNYANTEDFGVVEILYKGKDVSMVVMLPRRQDSLSEMEKKLSAKSLAQSLSAARPERPELALPKFNITREFNLVEDLRIGHQGCVRPCRGFLGHK